MPTPVTVFTFPNGRTMEVNTGMLDPEHKDYEAAKRDLTMAANAWGGEPEAKERGVSLPAKAKALISAIAPLVIPGGGGEMLGAVAQKEASADFVRGSTDVVLPGLGGAVGVLGAIPGAAGGGLVGGPPGAVAGGIAGGMAGRAAGGAGGQILAGKLQEALGVQPSEASPLIAGGIEALAGPAGKMATGLLRGGVRRAVGGKVAGEAAETTVERMGQREAAYARMGVDNPSIPQLVADETTAVPHGSAAASAQQLGAELPFFKTVTNKWLRKEIDSLNSKLGAFLGVSDPAATAKVLNTAAKRGTKHWEMQLGTTMDETFDVMPLKRAQPASAKPVIDELVRQGIAGNDEVIAALAKGDESEKLLAAFIQKYSTGSVIHPGGGATHTFRDATVGELDDARKALGSALKDPDSVLGKTPARRNQHTLYGRFREANREVMEDLEKSRQIPSGTLAKYEDAMEQWTLKSESGKTYMDRLLKELAPEINISKAVDSSAKGRVQDAERILKIKERILKDPLLGKEAWADAQDMVINLNSRRGGKFDMPTFQNWFDELPPSTRDALFDAEHQSLLKDMRTVSTGPWPMEKKVGPSLMRSEFEKPSILGRGLVGAGALGMAGGAGGIASGESGAGSMTAIIGLAVFGLPLMAQKAVTSKTILKFIKKTSKMTPDQYHNYISAMAGGLVNSIQDPKDAQQYQDAINIMNLINQIGTMEQSAKQGSEQANAGMPGILGR